ncbi:ATP-binding protein [Dactylosporangium fulvum]|uniref:ATP-binding protein n=1 Tax=Dactylosporangium fulvum TaxID=53359 RepID=A0ABY5W5A4_9ACTN|nr:ATP-binding protein [Dactylosporangium fulvum]UWP84439.1 ATP-binding protein [Dactylosporangium fulvum]
MDGALTGIADRRLTQVLADRLSEEPTVVLNGPRTVGKSTLLNVLAQRLGTAVIDCDDPATRGAVRNDPGRFVAGPGPVLIDEFQHVPELLDAIKAELNRDLRPGRFVLAGSTRYSTLPQAGQSLTGRVDIIDVLPLAQMEIDGDRDEPFVHRLLSGASPGRSAESSPTSRDEYARRVTSGGMPVALRRPPGRSRSRWFSNYLDLVIERDVIELSRVRQREMLPRLLNQLAARSGQVLNIAATAQAVGMEKSSAENYLRLLEAVFLIHRLPAWGTTLGSRVARQPKVHLVDSGVMAWLLGLTPEKIAKSDPAVLTEYGHLLETFAVGEVLKQVSWWDAPVSVGHFRTPAADEVDLVLERDDGDVIAFEIKSGTRVHNEDLRGMRALRARLGNRLIAGLVLYTGALAYTHDDGTHVVPIDALWR